MNIKRIAVMLSVAFVLAAWPFADRVHQDNGGWLQRAVPKTQASVTEVVSYNETGQPFAQGTGFVVGKDGIICTNYHVVRMAHAMKVIFHDGRSMDVTGIVDFDRDKDYALLKVSATNLPTLALDDSDQVNVGESVAAIGNPLGLKWTVSQGIVSQMRSTDDKMIQLDIAAAPGSSGGPLIDSDGKVIGIITAIAKGGENITFAVPINLVKDALSTSGASRIKDVKAYYDSERQHAIDELLSQFHNYNDPFGFFNALVPKDWPAERSSDHFTEGTEHVTSFATAEGSGGEIRVMNFVFSEAVQGDATALANISNVEIGRWMQGYQNVRETHLDGVKQRVFRALDASGQKVVLMSTNVEGGIMVVAFKAPGNDDLCDLLATIFGQSLGNGK